MGSELGTLAFTHVMFLCSTAATLPHSSRSKPILSHVTGHIHYHRKWVSYEQPSHLNFKLGAVLCFLPSHLEN